MKNDLMALANAQVFGDQKETTKPIRERETPEKTKDNEAKEEKNVVEKETEEKRSRNLYSNYEEDIPLEKITPTFDLSGDGIYIPLRAERGQTKAGHSSKNIYLTNEEYEYGEKVARKHRMSFTTYVRTLIVNSK